MTENEFYTELQNHKGDQYLIPHFDFSHGSGLNSRVLFLLESPGPQVRNTGLISLKNNDLSARYLNEQLAESHADLKDIVLWNIVPWIMKKGTGFATPSGAEIKEARKFTFCFLRYFEKLRQLFFLAGNRKEKCRFIQGTRATFYSPHTTREPKQCHSQTGGMRMLQFLSG
jgi:hypothetical protein